MKYVVQCGDGNPCFLESFCCFWKLLSVFGPKLVRQSVKIDHEIGQSYAY